MDNFSQIPATRVISASSGGGEENNKNITKVLADVQEIKRVQDNLTSKLVGMKRENDLIWREYASLRQKFSKQQEIIEKVTFTFYVHCV